MKAVDRRANAILHRLPPGIVTGVEVGVFRGRLAERLLARSDLRLHMVDSWAPSSKQPASYRASGDLVAQMSASEMACACTEAVARTAFAKDRRAIYRNTSAECATFWPNYLFDFVFIDADHSYEGVCADIEAWLPKVKVGGLLCGHDYGNPSFPGVKRAVDERFAVELGDDNTWFFRVAA